MLNLELSRTKSAYGHLTVGFEPATYGFQIRRSNHSPTLPPHVIRLYKGPVTKLVKEETLALNQNIESAINFKPSTPRIVHRTYSLQNHAKDLFAFIYKVSSSRKLPFFYHSSSFYYFLNCVPKKNLYIYAWILTQKIIPIWYNKISEEALLSRITQKISFLSSPTGVEPMTFQNTSWML